MAPAATKSAPKRKRVEEDDEAEAEDANTTLTMDSAMEEITRLRTALKEFQTNYTNLVLQRLTEPERKLASLIQIVEKRKAATDGRLNEALEEVNRLRKHTALWRQGVDVLKEVDKRELECERLKEEVKGLKREVLLRDEMVRTAQSDKSKAEQDVIQLEKALQFEGEQSKIATTKLKELQANQSSTKPYAAPRNEQQQSSDSEERYQLISDLTGVTVTNITEVEDGQRYDCLLVDASRKRGITMSFQLIVHPDEQISYIPKLDPDRDSELIEVLIEPYDGAMRFRVNQLGRFYRTLWKSLLT